MEGEEVYHHSFLTSVLDGGKWSCSQLGSSTSGKYHPYPWKRRLVGPQIGYGLFGAEQSFFLLPEFESRTV